MERLWDVKDVSEYLKVPVATLRQWCSKKSLPYVKIGGHVRFRKEDVEKWVAQKVVGNAEPVQAEER